MTYSLQFFFFKNVTQLHPIVLKTNPNMLNKFATGDNSMSTPSMGPISEKRNDVVNNTGCVYKVRM